MSRRALTSAAILAAIGCLYLAGAASCVALAYRTRHQPEGPR